MNTVDKVLAVAEAEVGYLEKKTNSRLDDKTANAGSNNWTKYGRDMHKLYPSVMDEGAAWCDAFIDWCFYKAYGVANAKSLLGGNFDDYTVASAQLYKKKGAYYSTPRVGDQIFFRNDTRICHTGIVYKVDTNKVYTIEGNTSGASGVIANGGGVCKKSYTKTNSKIDGYGRPDYDVEAQPVDFVPYKVECTATALNIRSGPGTNCSKVGIVVKGHQFTIRKLDGYWGKVCVIADNPKGQTVSGWVSTNYVKKV